MTKYQALISKVRVWQQDPYYSTFNFSQTELKIIVDALETMQFLEIILRTRKEKLEKELENKEDESKTC